MKDDWSLLKSALKLLTKSFLTPLELTAAAAAAAVDAGSHKKFLSSETTPPKISKEEMENTSWKKVKSFKDSGLLTEGVIKTIENYTTEQRGRFLAISLCTLGANLLENISSKNRGVICAGHWVIQARNRVT